MHRDDIFASDPLGRCISSRKSPRGRGCIGDRNAGPSSRRLVDEIGVDVLWLKFPMLPVRLVAPAQKPDDHPAPLLHGRWRESALIAHPRHVLADSGAGTRRSVLATNRENEAKVVRRRHSSRGGNSPMKTSPLGRDSLQRLDIDALRSIWTKTCGRQSEGGRHRYLLLWAEALIATTWN